MTLDEMKRLKQEKGYTMAQLSERSKVPLGTLQKIFTGETAHPRFSTRQAIEKVLCEDFGEPPLATCVREDTAAYDAKPEKQQGEYTVEDYYAWPDEQRIELIDGVIYIMEAPSFVHQRIAGEVFIQLDAFVKKKGGNCIPLISPLNVRLDCDDKTMVQPDLVILCDTDKIKRWGIMGAPDFILEILSPSTRRKDSIKKLQKYSDAGVKEYWILDPHKKLLLTYDFTEDCLPRIYPLADTAGLALYGGELQIDLDEIAKLIQDWPE